MGYLLGFGTAPGSQGGNELERKGHSLARASTATKKKARAVPQEMLTSFVECKTLGHAWDEINPPATRSTIRRFGTRWAFKCLRCDTIRDEVFSRTTGELTERRYLYPPGYTTVSKGLRRSDWRVELWKRAHAN